MLYILVNYCGYNNLVLSHGTIVNREFFVVEIFLDSKTISKIKCTKICAFSNGNKLRGHSPENYF